MAFISSPPFAMKNPPFLPAIPFFKEALSPQDVPARGVPLSTRHVDLDEVVLDYENEGLPI